METDNRLGTIEDVLGSVDPEVAAIVMRLREIVIAADPETTEQPRPGDRALSYGVGPRKMIDAYCYLMPQKGYVNLGFYKGATLPDPDGLLEGTGKMLRHVKVRSLEDCEKPGIRALIDAAIAERKNAAE